MTASADRGLRPERAAEIIVGLSGGGRRGSGYLVAPGRVLTAAHVVAGADGIRVRFQADRPGERVVEAVVAWAHDGIDVAVLVLSGDTDEDVAPVSYGTVGDQDAVLGCTAMGFPVSSSARTRQVGVSGTRSTWTLGARCWPTGARAPWI